MRNALSFLLLALLLVGCPDDDDDSGPDDDDSAGADDDDTDDDDDASDDDDTSTFTAVISGLVYTGGAGGRPGLAGTEIDVVGFDDDGTVTDADGTYTLDVPGDQVVYVSATAAGLIAQQTRVNTGLQTNPESGVLHPMLSPALISEVHLNLPSPYDSTLGSMFLVLSGTVPLVGTEVTLEADNIGGLSFADGPPTVGTTWLASTVFLGFFGIEPGSTALTASGLDCGEPVVQITADTLTYVQLDCQ